VQNTGFIGGLENAELMGKIPLPTGTGNIAAVPVLEALDRAQRQKKTRGGEQ
jgi:hypothetical protein